jgi:two-component system alkaline phosphatase synthesis response regulator PhoP
MPVYIGSEKGGFLMIYCVEDESSIRDLMLYTLKASGFDARGFEKELESFNLSSPFFRLTPSLLSSIPLKSALSLLSALRSSGLLVLEFLYLLVK